MSKNSKIIILFIIIFSISCSLLKVNNTLLGDWKIVNINNTQFNVSPEISFYINNNGKITTPSKEILGFNYKIIPHSNKIILIMEDKNTFFNKKEYFFKISTENKSKILKLISKDSLSSHILVAPE